MKTEVTEIPEVFSNQKVIVKRVILNKDNYSGII
jgi:hypothetical protein